MLALNFGGGELTSIKAFKTLDISRGLAFRQPLPSQTPGSNKGKGKKERKKSQSYKKKRQFTEREPLDGQDGDRCRYLLRPFLSYAFVCIYLQQRRHKSKKQ